MNTSASAPDRTYLVPCPDQLLAVQVTELRRGRPQVVELDLYTHAVYDLYDADDNYVFVADLEYGTIAAAVHAALGDPGARQTQALKAATKAVKAITDLSHQQAHAVAAEGRLDLVPHGGLSPATHPGAGEQYYRDDATWAGLVDSVRLGYTAEPGDRHAMLAAGVLLRSGGVEVPTSYGDSISVHGPAGEVHLDTRSGEVDVVEWDDTATIDPATLEALLETWRTCRNPLTVAQATADAVGATLDLQPFAPRGWCDLCHQHVPTDHDHEALYGRVEPCDPPAGHATVDTAHVAAADRTVGWFDARGWAGERTAEDVAHRRIEVHASRIREEFWTDTVARHLNDTIDGINAKPGGGPGPGMVAVHVTHAGDDDADATERIEINDVDCIGFYWEQVKDDEVWELVHGQPMHDGEVVDPDRFYTDVDARQAVLDQLAGAVQVFATRANPSNVVAVPGIDASDELIQLV